MSRSIRVVVRTLLPASAAAAVFGWVVAPAWTAPAPAGLGLTVLAAPQNVRPGDTISAKVTVTNGLDVPVDRVSVSAPGAPDCARSNLSLPAKSEFSYRCAMTAGEPGTHRASMTVTGRAGGKQLSATARVPYKSTGRGYYPAPSHSASPTPSCHQPMPSRPPSHGPSASPSTPDGVPPCFPRSPRLPDTGDRGVPAALWLVAAGSIVAGAALMLLGRRRRAR